MNCPEERAKHTKPAPTVEGLPKYLRGWFTPNWSTSRTGRLYECEPDEVEAYSSLEKASVAGLDDFEENDGCAYGIYKLVKVVRVKRTLETVNTK